MNNLRGGGRWNRQQSISVEGIFIKAVNDSKMWNKQIVALPLGIGIGGDAIFVLQQIIMEIKKTKQPAQYIKGDKRLETQYQKLLELQNKNTDIECWYAICFYKDEGPKKNKEQWANLDNYRFFRTLPEIYVMKKKDGLTWEQFVQHTKN